MISPFREDFILTKLCICEVSRNITLAKISEFTVNVLKFPTFSFFCSQIKKLVFKAGIDKMLVRIANREAPDLGLPCLSRLFWQATRVPNFRTFTV